MITAMLMTNAVAPLTAPQPAMPAPGPVPGEQPSFGQQLQRATERSAVERDDGAEEHPAQAVHAPAHSDNAAPVADRSRSGRKPAQATEHASADGKTADKASGEAAAAAGPAAEEPASECAPDEAASAAEVVPDLAAFVASLAGHAAAARATPTAVASSAAGDDAPARVAAASKARHGARTDSPLGLAEGTPAATTPGAAPAAAAAAETTGAIAAAPSSLPAPSPAALHAAAAHLHPAASRTDAAAAASHGAAPPPATGDGVRFDALLADAAAGRGNGTPTELPRVEPTPVLQAAQAADRAGAAANFTTPVPVAEATLAEPLGSRDFAHALGARVAVFARDGIEHARLTIHPAELGPIALQLALDGTQVRVEFGAEAAATRQALEQSLPSLASALSEAGLTLTGGGVFQQARGSAGQARQAGTAARGGGLGGPQDEAVEPTLVTRAVRLDGLVDLYA